MGWDGMGWEKIFCTNGNKKKAGVAILILDKVDFKMKIVAKDKGHYITVKRWIQQGIIPASNAATPKYIKQILTDIKREIDSNIVIVGHFSTPLV